MSQDLFLGDIDPVTGIGLGGFSLKSIAKAVKKVASPIQKVVAKAAPVASFLPIPGAGLVSKALSSSVGKKATAVAANVKKVQAVLKAPPPVKPPPVPTKPVPTLRAGSRKTSGSFVSTKTNPFADVSSGSSTTANKPLLAAAKKVIVKKATVTAAKKVAPKAKIINGKISTLPVQAKAAGITFRKRTKKTGGTEVVPVNAAGAVVGDPIPTSTLVRTGTPVVDAPPLPADAPTAPPPPVPSIEQAQAMIANAVSASVPSGDVQQVSSGGGGGGSVAYPVSSPVPTPETPSSTPSSSLFGNPLVLAGAAGVAVLILPKLLGGRH